MELVNTSLASRDCPHCTASHTPRKVTTPLLPIVSHQVTRSSINGSAHCSARSSCRGMSGVDLQSQ